MRMRLRNAKMDLSPERALERESRIQHHSVKINASTPIKGVSNIDATASAIYEAMNLKKPSQTAQLGLL